MTQGIVRKRIECVCRRCRIRYLGDANGESGSNPGVQGLCPGCRALQRLRGRRRGMVKWYDRRRGYGFVRDEISGDLFVHTSQVRGRTPRAGQSVTYRAEMQAKGWAALDVRPSQE